jgi:phage baseplate assembly protein W
MTQPGDFGIDLATVWTANGPDLDSGFTEARGINVLAQSLVRRLSTPHGSVAGCPNDCLDVRTLLGSGVSNADAQAIQAAVQNEIQRDARVMPASTVRASYNTATRKLSLVLRIVTAAGPFTMTLAVDSVTVELLNVSAN